MRKYINLQDKELVSFIAELKKIINLKDYDLEALFSPINRTRADLILYDFEKGEIINIGSLIAYFSNVNIPDNIFFYFYPHLEFFNYYKSQENISLFQSLLNGLEINIRKLINCEPLKRPIHISDFLNEEYHVKSLTKYIIGSLASFEKVPFTIEMNTYYTFDNHYKLNEKFNYQISGESQFPFDTMPEPLAEFKNPLYFSIKKINNRYYLTNNEQAPEYTDSLTIEVKSLEDFENVYPEFIFNIYYKQILELSGIYIDSFEDFKKNEIHYHNLLEMTSI